MLKKLLFFITLVIAGCLNAQTFYWVGGSGNWNDATHWSHISGGAPANEIPSANSNVVFDNASSANNFTIQAINSFGFKSISAQNTQFIIDVIGSTNADLTINGDVALNEYFNFRLNGKINLSPQSDVKYQFSLNKFTNDIFINSDSQVQLGVFSTTKSLSVTGNVLLKNSTILANDLLINNAQVDLERITIQISNAITLNNTQITTKTNQKSTIICKKNDLSESALTTFANARNLKVSKLSPQACNVTLTSKTDPTCAGLCDGTAIFDLSGCTNSPFIIDWDPNNSSPCLSIPPDEAAYSSATYSVNALCGCGTQYSVLFENSIGDQVVINFGIADPPSTILTFSKTQPTCNGLCNGQIRLFVASGDTPLSINWIRPPSLPAETHSNIVTRDTLKNACAGIYTLNVTNNNGCVNTFTTVLLQPNALTPNGSQTNIACNGSCTGSAAVAPTGGTSPYTYSWVSSVSTPSTSSTSTIGNLCPGVVTMTVTDSKTCTATYSTTITSPPAITLTLTKTNLICGALCDGAATITPTGGGGGPYTSTWTPMGSGFASTGLCAGPYTVTVMDNLNCVKFVTFTITAPPTLTATPTQTNLTCNAACIGAINLNPSGGTGSYTFSWSPNVSTASTATALCAGAYSYTVTDAVSCTYTNVVTITQPPAITLTVTKTDVTCFGACNGIATASVSGGTGAFTFTWSPAPPPIPGQGTRTITPLCPGTYSLIATDALGCFRTASVTITQPPAITLTVTKTNLICGALCDGAATITPTGGGGSYTSTWTPMGSGFVSTGLCAGPYTVTVTDNLNCVKAITFTLTAPVTLTATPTQTNLTCNSACIGAINLNPSGGTGAYAYSWSPAVSTGSTATGLCAGAYSFTVTDAVSCTYTNVVTITQPPAITLTVTKTDVTCFNACNGIATANVSGGTGAFTFTWSPVPVPPPLIGQGTRTITSLCPGTYSVIATDFNGCFRTGSVTVTQPLVITPNTSSVSPTCGLCNGSINAAPTGGTGAYTFTLLPASGSPTVASPPYTGLCANSYTLIIKDAANCTITQVINLTQPNPITLSLTATPISCFNQCSSTITASITGGTPNYTVNWSPAGTGTIVAGRCAGVHTATVTDANGCQAINSITITAPTEMTVAISAVQPNCNAQCTGIATASVTGGTSGYTVSWSNGFTGNPNPNLCNGIYTATVTDLNGCTKTQTIAIITPPALTLTATSGSVACAVDCNGSVSVLATGGTSGYTYSWSPSAQTTSVAVNLCAGNYTVAVTDNKGCIASATASVSQPPALTVAISNVQPSCNVCIGKATADGIGGTPGYTYSWSGGQTGPSPTNLCVGVHTVTVTDSRGCPSTQTVQIIQTINILITSNGTTLACNGDCTGIATANATGGTGSYDYTWTPTNQNGQQATALCSGPHTVLVEDGNGCSNTSVVTFASPPAVTLTVNQTNVTCNSLCNGSATATATGGTGSITYLWSNGATTPVISGLCAGDYTVTVRDANNCSRTQTLTITENSALTATFTSNNPSNCGLTDGSISFVEGGGTGPYTFTWTPVPLPPANPLLSLGAGTYVLNLEDANGCSLSFTTTLSNPVGPTVTVTSNSIICFGACTGSASLSITSATPSFTIGWSMGPANTTTLATGLCAGNYIATVTDENTCVTNQTLTIAEPPQITSTGTVTNVSCNAACSGSIDITASGGTAPLSYSWSPAGGSDEDPTNLCANTYSVIISDVNSCTVTNTYLVTQPTALTLSFNKKDVSCNGLCNGAVRAVVGGGVFPYTYTWTPLGSFPGSNLDTIINLCPGIYTVIAQDLNLCTITNTVSIAEPAVLTSTITTTNVTCNAQCNGTATISPTGGTLPYTYTPAQITSTLCAGNYTGIVTDLNGCSSSNSFTITEPLPIVITTTVSNPKCNAVCNGSVATTVSGGNSGSYTYSWMPVGIPPVPNPTGLCAGIYTVTVSDVSLCTNTAVVTLIEPTVLAANISFTNPVCNGACTGIVTANPTGGTTPYSYLWASPTNTNQTASGLCIGDYTVIVTDSNSCQDTQTVTLTSPTAMSVTPVFSLAICNVSNGSIDVSATIGGTPGGYTYNWLNPILAGQVNNIVVTGIPAGIYTVVVTDLALCSDTFQLFLSDADGPTDVTITTTSVTCNGLCNGTATLSNPIGGTAPLTMSWATDPLLPNPLAGLCAGPIVALVTDANGCLLFKNDTIIEPQVIVANETITGALCFGVCTGSIVLNPTGGDGNYTYLWSTADITPTITNLCPSVYSVTITDGQNCAITASYNLPSLTTITANIVAADNSCYNKCNGMLFVTNVAGGLPNYTYQWPSLGQSTPTVTGLCNGTYSVIITDANGCFNAIAGTITSPSQVTFTPTITEPTCGMCNGVAVINPVGGTLGYSYVWSNSVTTNTATGLCAGVYAVEITDGNGCITADTNVIINSSSTFTGEIITKTNESCAGLCDGTVTVTAIGGNGTITYHWVHNNSNSQSLTGLCAGTYFCNMTDATGCIRTASVVIGSVTTLTISSQVTQSSCSASTGSISVNVTGGTTFYTYTWLPLGTGSTATVTNLAPGSYTLNVSDGGCTKTQIFAVSTFSAPILNVTEKDISCFGGCDGNIAITISAGTPTYSTVWSNSVTTNSISGLCAGAYAVQVTDAAGCVAVQNFSLSQASPIVFSTPDINNELCFASCNGSITAIPTGGILPYTFSWTPTATPIPTSDSLCTGNYSVTIIDKNGCLATESYTISGPAPLTLTAVVTDASCSTVPDGAVDITVAGGTPINSYSWTPGPFFTEDLTSVLPGTYSLSITDGNGCKKDSTILIDATIVVIAVAGNDSTLCFNGLTILNGSNSIGAVTYQWLALPSGTVVSTAVLDTVTTGVGTNTYVLAVTSTSNALCMDKDTIIINVNPLPIVDAGPFVSIPTLATAVIGGNPTSITASSYTWIPSLTLDNPSGSNPTTSTTVTANFTVTVTDTNGCLNSDTVTVYVFPEINIPNGFSPNGDGKNDVWQIDLIYLFPDTEVEVYNRWGEQLFYSKGYAIPFNGQYKGKDLPVGTYYYVIKLNNPTYPDAYTGPLTIFR